MVSVARTQTRRYYQGNNATSTSWSHKVLPGGNRMLRVKVWARNNGTVSPPTYGGTALTLVPGSEIAAGTGTARRYVSWWYMLSPPVGTATLSLTVAAADSGNYGVIAYNDIDVDQTTPFRDQGGGNFAVVDSGTAVTSSTLTPASSPGDLVISALYAQLAPTMAAGQYKEAGGGSNMRCWTMSKEAESGTTSIGATMASGTVVHSAIAIIGDATTQPDPADYTGARGKKSWFLSTNLAGESLGAGSTLYCPVCPSVESSSDPNTLGGDYTWLRLAGTVSAPQAIVASNATTADSTYTLLVSDVPSAVTITIPAGATGLFQGSGSVAIADTDKIAWKLVTGAGGAVLLTHLSAAFEADSEDTVTTLGTYSSSAGKLTPGETRYVNPHGTRATTTGNVYERKAAIPVLMDASWKNLGLTKTGTNTNGVVTLTARINQSDGTQALSWPASTGGNQEDTTHADVVADGDSLALQLVSAGSSGDFEYERLSSKFITDDGEFIVMSAATPAGMPLGSAGTQYASMGGELSVSNVEANTQIASPFDMAGKRLFVLVGENASLATGSSTAVLRINGVDTALNVDFSAHGEYYYVADLENVVEWDAGDLISISVTHGTGGTNNTLRLRGVGFVAVERSAASTTRGRPFGSRGNAFNGGRALTGVFDA